MFKSTHLTTFALLLALEIFPARVKSYNCQFNPPSCGNADTIVDFSSCFLSQFSISLFIQCADLDDTPYINAAYQDEYGDEKTTPLTPLQILVNGTSIPACNVCALQLDNIYNGYTNGPNAGTFGSYLCQNDHPTNKELCCLSSCVMAKENEHSIADFCKPGHTDLMLERTLGSCDTGDTGDSAAATSPIQNGAAATSSIPNDSALSSTVAATSSATESSTTQASTTQASTTALTPASTTSTKSSASRCRVTTSGHMGVFGLVVILMVAAF
ncbi:hypothetical protein MMC28_005999 [Mycoblastus sanguinarius]|nr:hypothetical protein [Mycoblastus sanguinarius]